MWWKCDVQVQRTVLRLKLWARSEGEARTKVERMYQLATIQNLTLSNDLNPLSRRTPGVSVACD